MGAGNSGLFRGTYGAKPYAGSLYYMSKKDFFSIYIKRRKDVDTNGFFDIIAHGSPDSILIEINGKKHSVNHRTASKLFRNNKEYKGQSIRLLSCDTGAKSKGFAQNLANKLNVVVEAPTKKVWAYPSGQYLVADAKINDKNKPDLTKKGTFIKYYPGGYKK